MPRCACTPTLAAQGRYCAVCAAYLARVEDASQTAPSVPVVPQSARGVGADTPQRATEAARGLPGHIALILSPLRIHSPLNGAQAGSRLFRERLRRHKHERQAAYYWLRHWCPGFPAAWSAVAVRLTRVAPRDLDSDNLAAALKHVRDGVADWWDGKEKGGDDRQPSLAWEYAQKRGGAGCYEVEIYITPREKREQ